MPLAYADDSASKMPLAYADDNASKMPLAYSVQAKNYCWC